MLWSFPTLLVRGRGGSESGRLPTSSLSLSQQINCGEFPVLEYIKIEHLDLAFLGTAMMGHGQRSCWAMAPRRNSFIRLFRPL